MSEISALLARLATAENESEQLKAHIADLERAISFALREDAEIDVHSIDVLSDALHESPQQSLAAIQADAVDAAMMHVLNLCHKEDIYRWDFIAHEAEQYAEQLRRYGDIE